MDTLIDNLMVYNKINQIYQNKYINLNYLL